MNPGCQVRHGQGRRLRAPRPELPAPTGLRCLSQRRPRRRTPGAAPAAPAPCQGHWGPRWDHRCPQCGPSAACGHTSTALSPGPPATTACPHRHGTVPMAIASSPWHHPTATALAPRPHPRGHGSPTRARSHGFMSHTAHPCPTHPPVPTVPSQPPCPPYPLVPVSSPRPSARPAATLSRGTVRAKVSAVKPGWHDAARWHSRCPLCPERGVSTGRGPGQGPAAPGRVSPGSQARSCRPSPWLTWSRSKRRQSGTEQPARRPMAGAGAGWCRRDRALPPRSRRCVASRPVPSRSRSRPAGVHPAGNRPVPPRREAVPPHPEPRCSRYPRRPVSRYCCGASATVPDTVVPPLPLQPSLPPVPPTPLVLCPSRVPPAPRAPDIASPRAPGLSTPLPCRADGAGGVGG